MHLKNGNLRGIGRASCLQLVATAMEAKAGTLESPWRRGMFGRVSQKIYGRAGNGTVQKIKKMK